MLQDPELDDLEKIQTALQLYFPGVVFDPDVLDEAISKMVWFYRCGVDPAETTGKSADDTVNDEPPFSYEHDADYIFSAFMQAYGICYRTMKIPAKMSKEQRQHYEKMKRIYALPQSADRQQLESDLNNLLMNGGNPAALLNGSEVRSWHQMEP